MSKYSCIPCKYESNKVYNYSQHCNTIKHKKNTGTYETIIYVCEYCSKKYNRNNSLWYHQQKCKIVYANIMKKSNIETQNSDIIQVMKQEIIDLKDKVDPLTDNMNDLKEELKDKLEPLNEIKELKEKINDLKDKIENVKPVVFNLNVFLNEDCKNAISFDELLDQLQYHFDSSKTLTEDITITVVKKLSTMKVYDRPIHCVDLKRNKLMIKDNDKWTKDISVFNKLPKHASKKYSKHINEWTESNPDFLEDDDKSYQYNVYANKEMQDINTPKIIRNVSKVTTIPKKEIKNEDQ